MDKEGHVIVVFYSCETFVSEKISRWTTVTGLGNAPPHRWRLEDGTSVGDNRDDPLATYHYQGMADLIYHATIDSPPFICVQVGTIGAVRRAARVVLTPRGAGYLESEGTLPCAAVLCMALARLRDHGFKPGPVAKIYRSAWPRPVRGRPRLQDHHEALVHWLKNKEAVIEQGGALEFDWGYSLPLGSAHHIDMFNDRPCVTIRRGECQCYRGVATGGCIFAPPGAGKAFALASHITDTPMVTRRALATSVSRTYEANFKTTTATLIIAKDINVRKWGDVFSSLTNQRVIMISSMNDLNKVPEADVTNALAVVIGEGFLSSPAYTTRLAQGLSEYVGLQHQGSLGDIIYDPNLLTAAAEKAAESGARMPVLMELFQWCRIIWSDCIPRSVGRFCAGVTWATSGRKCSGMNDVKPYYRALVTSYEESMNRIAAEGYVQELVWIWEPKPPRISVFRHEWTPSSIEHSIATARGQSVSDIALIGVPPPMELHRTSVCDAIAAVSMHSVMITSSLRDGSERYSHRAMEYESHEDLVPNALIEESINMDRRAEQIERSARYLNTTLSEFQNSSITCPVCHEEHNEAIFLICGHATCTHCSTQIIDRSSAASGALCPVCRGPFGAGGAWLVANGKESRDERMQGTLGDALARVARYGERVVFWAPAGYMANMKKALQSRDIHCITVKGTHRARLAQIRRFQKSEVPSTLILSFSDDVDSTPPLGLVTDVAIFGIHPPAHVVREALSHAMAPRGAPQARVHLIDSDVNGEANINFINIPCQ